MISENTIKEIGDLKVLEVIQQDEESSLLRARGKGDTGGKYLIKMLRYPKPSLASLAQLRHEFEITRNIDTEFVTRAVDIELGSPHPRIILDDIKGQLLSAIIKNQALDQRRFLKIAISLAGAVGELHRLSIIHKNIGPQSVFWNEKSGVATLTDLCFASRLSVEDLQISPNMHLEGSLAYISPEQSGRINRTVDHRTDLYALGATFYEMLAGQPPFIGEDMAEIIHAHIAKQPVPLHEIRPGISPTLSKIVSKLLEKDADDRYQSAYGLRNDLEKCHALLVLDNDNNIPEFELGQNDFAQIFRLSQRIFGRVDEHEKLKSAFQTAVDGQQTTLIVKGPPGIGKSTLIQELRQPVEAHNGFMLAGKYDQIARTLPYVGILGGFRGFIQQLLAESDHQLAEWKSKILAAVETNGRVITEILPEMEAIIGPQPEIGELGPTEARNRFNRTWRRLIGAIVSTGRPLVLFLDDLQWADSASLNFIEQVIIHPETENVLLVCAYRDSEVSASHPLAFTLERIQRSSNSVTELELEPLGVNHVTQWLQDSLRNKIPQLEEVSVILHEKTGGNPFFIIEFLRSMYRDKLFRFDDNSGQWKFRLKSIKTLDVTENVADLVLNRIEELTPDQKTLIMCAACIGDAFGLALLARINERSKSDVFDDVLALVGAGLLQLSSDYQLSLTRLRANSDDADADQTECRFPHDRIRQAAYSLILDDVRRDTHGKIGHILLENQSAERDGFSFNTAAVDHLNIAYNGERDDGRLLQLAQLNARAGSRAKHAAAPEVALYYFLTGCNLMENAGWDHQRALTMELNLGLAEMQYLSGQSEAADKLCDELLARCKDDEEKIQIYKLKVTIYTSLSKCDEALDTGVLASQLLGLKLPRNPTQLHIALEFLSARARLAGKSNEDLLNMAPMTDEVTIARLQLLTHLVAPAFLTTPNLAILISLKMLNATLRHGLSDHGPYGFMIFGVANAGMGNFAIANKYGELALQLAELRENVEFRHMLHFLYGTAINHWQSHAKGNLAHLEKSYDIALSAGDLVYADYSLITALVDGFFLGEPLKETAQRCQQYLDFFELAKGIDPIETSQGVSTLIHKIAIAGLMGETPDPAKLTDAVYSEKQLRDALPDELARFGFCAAKLQLHFLFDDPSIEPPEIEEGAATLAGVKVMADVRLSEYCLYAGLTLLRLIQGANGKPARRYRKLLKKCRNYLSTWSKASPDNYACRYQLLEAEIASFDNRPGDAEKLYRQAIESADTNNYLQITALANELAARSYKRQGNAKIASLYLSEARYAYQKWGATAKIELLDKTHPELQISHANTQGPYEHFSVATPAFDNLDVNSLLKAASALSGEIELDRLIRKLLDILIENAGADKAVLIVKRDKAFLLEGVGTYGAAGDEHQYSVAQSIPVSRSEDLPLSIFNYAIRTGETVIANDARSMEQYARDAYLKKHEPKSILLVPLVHQGDLNAVIYLQNTLATHAFTPQRLEFIKLLSGQVAISLENARLFEHQARLTQSASNFVPHEFLQLLNRRGLEEVELGEGIQRNLVIMFADMRGFTTMSENMTPREGFEFINQFFQVIGPAVRQHRGFVGKYLGDGIMGFFPETCNDALDASLEIMRRLRGGDGMARAEGAPQIRIGIGLHFGSVLLGIVGEEKRLQCDAVSDAANVTARIEQLAKFFRTSVIVSEALISGLKNPQQYNYRSLGRAEVAGRRDPIQVYEVFDNDFSDGAEDKYKSREQFEQGLEHFAKRKFAAAKRCFEKVLAENPDDYPALVYRDNAEKFAQSGVADDWRGVPRFDLRS